MTIEPRILDSIASIEAGELDALDHGDNPFLSATFLGALESTGVLDADSGWTPHHLALFENDRLLAFAPTYVKTHSHGEFVFDWAWADAYRRHGVPYYPKLLTGIPYSPVSGRRLLVRSGEARAVELRRRLARLAIADCEAGPYSSWHCNFVTADDGDALGDEGLLSRRDWQFHWFNDEFTDFDAFLERLRSRKRKNIRRERRQVRDAGVTLRRVHGSEVTPEELDFIYLCYLRTFRLYGNHPALNRSFFECIADGLGRRFVAVIAERRGQPLAMSLYLAGGGRLYGRYWGCLEDIPGLHFETAYYQGIEYCIEFGLRIFESGAQGEHKLSRGFLPQPTCSRHFIREHAFRDAIARYLERELQWSINYGAELSQHNPYREDPG